MPCSTNSKPENVAGQLIALERRPMAGDSPDQMRLAGRSGLVGVVLGRQLSLAEGTLFPHRHVVDTAGADRQPLRTSASEEQQERRHASTHAVDVRLSIQLVAGV